MIAYKSVISAGAQGVQAVWALQLRNDAGAGAHAQGDRLHICDLCLRAWRKAVAATYAREHGMMSPTAAL